MKKFLAFFFGLWAFLAVIGMGITSAAAAPALQSTPFPTPTPGADGRILYIVQPGDTLWLISSVSGLSLDELRALNQVVIGSDDTIQPGDQLLLGIGGPVEEPTVALAVTPLDQIEPTPTPGLSTGLICILLFNDLNGDSLRQESEIAIPDGAISVTERNGLYSQTQTTQFDEDETCFPDLPEGTYNITVAIPEGYNPTTELSRTNELKGGDTINLRMGAQISAVNDAAQEPTVEEGGRSPLLGFLGFLLIASGIGLGIFAVQRSRKPLKFSG